MGKTANPKKMTVPAVVQQMVADMHQINGYYQDLCDELNTGAEPVNRKRAMKIVEKIGKITGDYI